MACRWVIVIDKVLLGPRILMLKRVEGGTMGTKRAGPATRITHMCRFQLGGGWRLGYGAIVV